MACGGGGVVVGKQYICRSCAASGSKQGGPCPLCEGKCYVSFDQLQCSQCLGSGSLKGWLSNSECETCCRKGYLPIKVTVSNIPLTLSLSLPHSSPLPPPPPPPLSLTHTLTHPFSAHCIRGHGEHPIIC